MAPQKSQTPHNEGRKKKKEFKKSKKKKNLKEILIFYDL